MWTMDVGVKSTDVDTWGPVVRFIELADIVGIRDVISLVSECVCV